MSVEADDGLDLVILCSWVCVCGKRCGGVAKHGGDHQCAVHYHRLCSEMCCEKCGCDYDQGACGFLHPDCEAHIESVRIQTGV